MLCNDSTTSNIYICISQVNLDLLYNILERFTYKLFPFTGLKGAKGFVGMTGQTGDTGDNGVKGRRGRVGATGSMGKIGRDGKQGSDGSRGAIGKTGPTGYIYMYINVYLRKSFLIVILNSVRLANCLHDCPTLPCTSLQTYIELELCV